MGIGPRLGLTMLSLVTTAAAAPLVHRLVVVVGRPGDPRVKEQHAWLSHEAAALRERDVVVQDIPPEAAHLRRPRLGASSPAKFQVLLIGNDGGVKLRRDKPVAASEIIALIDTMPMRQDEMRRR